MTPDERDELARRIVMLAAILGERLEPARLAGYQAALDDLRLVDVVLALDELARTLQRGDRFPWPGDIRARVEGSPADKAARAWSALFEAGCRVDQYRGLLVEDSVAAAVFRSLFGGDWPGFCATELSPEMWAARRKEWLALYRSFEPKRRQLRGIYFPGTHERTNAARGLAWRVDEMGLLDAGGCVTLVPADAHAQIAVSAGSTPDQAPQLEDGFTRVGQLAAGN